MKLPVVLAVVATLAESSGAVAQPARAVVQWGARVAEADDLTPNARSYRLFQSPDQVSILLIFTNFSAFGVTIDTQRFRDLVRVKVRAGAEVPVETQWEWTLRRSGESYSTNVPEHVELEAGAGFAWAFTVRQTSGEVFSLQDYEIDIVLADAVSSLRDEDRNPYSGRILPSTQLHLSVALPETVADFARMHRLRARLAAEAGQGTQAIESYRRALAFLPDDFELNASLGHTYLGLNRYPEAAAVYERVLPAVAGRESIIPLMLALAYVGAGEEAKAAQLLESNGLPAARTPEAIRELRRLVAQRVKR
jgi:tetratricopeptide (TPR) repeat protein